MGKNVLSQHRQLKINLSQERLSAAVWITPPDVCPFGCPTVCLSSVDDIVLLRLKSGYISVLVREMMKRTKRWGSWLTWSAVCCRRREEQRKNKTKTEERKEEEKKEKKKKKNRKKKKKKKKFCLRFRVWSFFIVKVGADTPSCQLSPFIQSACACSLNTERGLNRGVELF